MLLAFLSLELLKKKFSQASLIMMFPNYIQLVFFFAPMNPHKWKTKLRLM